jgi:hypothetical protein
MAWTSPYTWVANKIVTAWQLRVPTGGNISYLYSIRTGTMTQTADLKAAATRDKGVTYQNTDDKARLCCVVVVCANTPYSLDATAECDSSTPPTAKFVAISSFSSGYSNNAFGSLFFIVPPLYYYKVEVLSNGAWAGVSRWFEWSM